MQGEMLRRGKIKKKRASPVRRKPYPVKPRFLCIDGITKHKGCQFEYSKRGMTIDRYVTIIKNRKKNLCCFTSYYTYEELTPSSLLAPFWTSTLVIPYLQGI